MPRITYTDKVTNQVSPLPIEEKFVSADANEIKDVVNAIIDPVGLLKSDGTDVSAATPGTDYIAGPGGADTQVQFNDAGVLAGSAEFVYDGNQTIGLGTSVNSYGNINLGGTGNGGGFIEAVGDDGIQIVASNADGAIGLEVNGVERLNIDKDGTWTVNGVVGTAGQVLTTNGPAAAPTWEDVPGSAPAGADTEIQRNVGGSFGAGPEFAFIPIANTLNIGDAGQADILFSPNGGTEINTISTESTGGVNINAPSGTEVSLSAPVGDVILTTAAQRLKIDNDGAWLLGVGEDAGTAGQVLTSAGVGTEPTWDDVPETFSQLVTVAGATYTATLADVGKMLECTNAAGCDITLSLQAAEAWVANDEILMIQAGTGTVRVLDGGGITVLSSGGALGSLQQYSIMGVKRSLTADTWYMFGERA